jgi:hypothetical protein
MGRATIHLDQAAWQSKQFFSDEQITQFWPKYPNDFCMVSVQPLWMEIIAPHKQIKGDAEKWRPAGMRFDT